MSILLFTLPFVGGAAATQATPDEMEVDHVVMTAELGEDGNATWTVEYRDRLETETERSDFELMRGMVEQNSADYEADFEAQMNTTLTAAEDSTGREMNLQNVSVSTDEIRFPQTYGIVRYEFTWENFAAVSEGDSVRALEMDGALSKLVLDSDTRLVIKWPHEYERTAVDPAPDSNRGDANEVMWTGPVEFASGEPQLAVEKEVQSSPQPTPGPEPTPGDPSTPTKSDFPTAPALLGGASLAIIGVSGIYLLYRRQRLPAVLTSNPTAATQSEEPTTAGESAVSEESSASAEDEAADADAEGETQQEIDFELLSNEEQVLHLLENNEGRMKQQAIVEETGWSAAKTSEVLNKMHSNDEIDKFRLGRENVVAKPESSKTDTSTAQ